MGNSLSVSRCWCKDAWQLSVGSLQRKTAERFSARLFTFSICLASRKHLSFIDAFNQARPARRLGFWETTAPLRTSQSLTFILHCPIHLVCVAPKVWSHSDTVFHTSTQCVYPSLRTPYPSLIAMNWGRGCVYCFGCGALSVRSTSSDHFHLICSVFPHFCACLTSAF